MVISTLNSGAGWRETGTAMYAPHQLLVLQGLFSVAATVPSGPRCFRQKRRNEATRVTH
jgi:hypothetical protein